MTAKLVDLELEREKRGLPPTRISVTGEILNDIKRDVSQFPIFSPEICSRAMLDRFNSILGRRREPREDEIVP